MAIDKQNRLKPGILLVAFLIPFSVFFSGCAKKTEKVYRVGILSGLDFFASTADGFKEEMAKLGYAEGKNIVYDLQKTNFDMARYRDVLKKFVADKVDLIFVFPTEASQEAKLATQGTDIPVVFSNANTEDTNLVNSIREPGGNITGVRWPGPVLALQRFEIMRKLAPQAKRMWIPYQRDYPIVKSQLEVLRPAFAAAGITLVEIPVDNTEQLKAELDSKAKEFNNTDAILMIAEPLMTTSGSVDVAGQFADEHAIPFGGLLMKVGTIETLFGIAPRNIPVGRQAAYLADKVLRGIKAGNIPVVSAEGYFQLNYKAAQELGLKVNEEVLLKADEIIR